MLCLPIYIDLIAANETLNNISENQSQKNIHKLVPLIRLMHASTFGPAIISSSDRDLTRKFGKLVGDLYAVMKDHEPFYF